MAVGVVGPPKGVLRDVALYDASGVLAYALSDETLAERIKRLRERTGLSQVDFADRAGLSREGYQKIERGITMKPDNDTIRAIAKAAGKPVGTLSRMLDWLPLDEADNDLLRDLTDEQREIVVELIGQLRRRADRPPDTLRPQRAARS